MDDLVYEDLEGKWRCCMCPNQNAIGEKIYWCPVNPKEPRSVPCRFIKIYEDERGWRYKVMQGLKDNSYKARYQKERNKGWKCVKTLPWREYFDGAQEDLNALAKKKKWNVVIP